MKLRPLERYIINCLLGVAVLRGTSITGVDGELAASQEDIVALRDRFSEYDWAYLSRLRNKSRRTQEKHNDPAA